MYPDGTINWVYVLTTLTIRFAGVFIILGVMYIGIYLSSKIVAALLPTISSKPTPKNN